MEGCRKILNKVCTCRCQGSGKFKAKELRKAGLEALKNYEIELRKELSIVRGRVDEIEAEK